MKNKVTTVGQEDHKEENHCKSSKEHGSPMDHNLPSPAWFPMQRCSKLLQFFQLPCYSSPTHGSSLTSEPWTGQEAAHSILSTIGAFCMGSQAEQVVSEPQCSISVLGDVKCKSSR